VYCFKVTNSGQSNLVGVEVTDDTLGIAPILIGDLSVGQSVVVSAPGLFTADLVNVARVEGVPPSGPPVFDEDDAEVERMAPGIEIQKTVPSTIPHWASRKRTWCL